MSFFLSKLKSTFFESQRFLDKKNRHSFTDEDLDSSKLENLPKRDFNFFQLNKFNHLNAQFHRNFFLFLLFKIEKLQLSLCCKKI